MNSAIELTVKKIPGALLETIEPEFAIITPEVDFETQTFTASFHIKGKVNFDPNVYVDRQISIIGKLVQPFPISLLTTMKNADLSWNESVVNAVLEEFSLQLKTNNT